MCNHEFPILIRASQLADEDDLIEICHLTGDNRINPYLLALRYCLDYLWHDTANCFVAEDPNTGKVVGYIVGTLDSRQQEQRLMKKILPRIKNHWRTLKPKSLAHWQGYLLIRASLRNPDRKLLVEYPAHLHINIHPDYQRIGIGSQLIRAFEQNLIQNSVTGFHLGVTGSNPVGISFYQEIGLEKLGQIPSFRHPLVIYYGRKLTPASQAE
jgi:ribosomal protein S18 acetylase RimI-like enzyme